MIDVQKTPQQWIVTLDRPDKANALTVEMLGRLIEVVSDAQADRELRALILTGAGDRVFSAGADLGAVKSGTPINQSPLWEDLSSRIARLPCLTVAALNGTLAGGAFGMALACDLRVAVSHANFFYPVMKNGLLPQPSDLPRFAQIAGLSAAKMVLLAGHKLSSAQALNCGLVDTVCEPDALMDTAIQLTEVACSADEAVLVSIKRLFELPQLQQTRVDTMAAVFDNDEAALKRLRNAKS